jgi:hypothetical protein
MLLSAAALCCEDGGDAAQACVHLDKAVELAERLLGITNGEEEEMSKDLAAAAAELDAIMAAFRAIGK